MPITGLPTDVVNVLKTSHLPLEGGTALAGSVSAGIKLTTIASVIIIANTLFLICLTIWNPPHNERNIFHQQNGKATVMA
jgi:hypothetical protein